MPFRSVVHGVIMAVRLKDKKEPAAVAAASAAESKPRLTEGFRMVFTTPTALILTVCFSGLIFVLTGYLTWMPTYLYENFGMDLAGAGFHSMFYTHLFAFVGVLLAGRLSDKLGSLHPAWRMAMQGFGLLAAVPFIVLMGNSVTLWVIYVGFAGFGFARAFFDANTYTVLYDVIPPRYHSSASGVMIMTGFAIGALAPLVLGMVDALAEKGIPAFGPNKAAAILEGSKVFSKNLMKKYGIPTAAYETFADAGEAAAYVRANRKYPLVVKADGLALGKGVLICEDEAAALAAVKSIMEDRQFGASGSRIVIEEFLTGPEVSVLSFTDGKTVVPMVSSMDHKRALDGDRGLNTGGMGTIAPNPYYTPQIAQVCMETIFKPTVAAMNAEGRPFKGCLYFGLMLTPDGPKVIEYNCRFGDPETQVVLPLLESDLLAVMQAATNGTLAQTEVKFSGQSAACVVLASGGYPQHYEKGKPITGLADGQLPGGGATVYHAGTALADNVLVTSGGRVLGVTAVADSLFDAVAAAYGAADQIGFEGLHRRSDIGQKALAAL